MLGRHDPQMDLADAVLWTGKIEPRPLVEKGSFHDRFAAVRATILRDEDFEHWFDAEQGRRSIPPSVVAGAFLLALREGCSDREAEQRMRYDLRWKWALGLGLNDHGCDHSSLCVFLLVLGEVERFRTFSLRPSPNTKSASLRASAEIWSADRRPLSNSRFEYRSGRNGESSEKVGEAGRYLNRGADPEHRSGLIEPLREQRGRLRDLERLFIAPDRPHRVPGADGTSPAPG
jgi:hypothetical protein